MRAKLVAIVGTAAFAFLLLTALNATIADQVRAKLQRVQEFYIPRLQLGPALHTRFDAVVRGLQDAAAALDNDALHATSAEQKAFLAELDHARGTINAEDVEALRTAFGDYYAAAYDVSNRLIRAETGEALVGAIASMQEKKRHVGEALDRVTAFDENELSRAFNSAAQTQVTASRLQTAVSITCLALVIALSVWLGRGVFRSLSALGDGFERFGKGQFAEHIQVTSHDEIGQVAERANHMADSLQRLGTERDDNDWLRGGTSGLLEELRGDFPPDEVARRSATFLAHYAGAQVAALYTAEGAAFRLAGAFAHADYTGKPLQTFASGQGLAGQAALSDEIIIVNDPPAGHLTVRSGLGESSPRCIAILPLLLGDRVSGILELAFWSPLSKNQQQLLQETRESIAFALEAARARAETDMLLAETQRQAARLLAQEEQLRATNEELQSQQSALLRSNTELSHQASELEAQRRTLEESNLQLDAMRKHLELKADELTTVSNYKSQFLTNMSHELRTPLNSMLLLSNLLAENSGKNLTDKQVEYSRTIHAAGKDLLALINQVLDLAKIESGKQEAHNTTIPLSEIIDRARRVFEALAKEKGLEFSAELSANAPATLTSDRQRLEQIITNLLGNAIKFTARGRVALRISLATDNRLEVSVSDTGAGIAAEDQARIFSPFEQVDGRVDRKYGGTGLGLTIARELTELLGGELRLQSTLGKGSTFTCSIPTGPVSAMAPRPRPDIVAHDDHDTLAPGEAHLLLVEDDRRFAEGFGEVIHTQGYKFLLADNAELALRLAKEAKPIGIILDVKLPDRDGFSLMQELQSDKQTAHIPVHFVTAIDARSRGLAMGAIGYSTKPTTRSELAAVVDALVARHREQANPEVLLVEADATASASLVELLGGEHLPVRRASNAAEALTLVKQQTFACVIVDLVLPDMQGLDFLRALEAQQRGAMPPIVVYSAHALSKDEAKQLNAYAEAIVLKEGLSTERLLSEVRLFVRRLKERGQQTPARPAPEVKLGGRSVLVVDDDMRTVYALSALLRSKGAEVFAADSGVSALRALQDKERIDVVLMDIMMPEMDGYTAIQHIRADKRFAHLPIIALTAKAMKGDEEKCLAAGANSYLAKPVDPVRLLELIDGQLRHVS